MKIVTIVGARPQFIKAAVIAREIAATDGIAEVMVHTGQHFDAAMSEIFFSELAIPDPAYNLNINGGGHGDMTGRMLAALERVMLEERPDRVLIYGDTNSTLAGALASAKLHIPVAHVEAGLRSFNRRMPEEINRVLADHVSDLLFCPTVMSVENLRREGIIRGVHNVGDVMYDATLYAAREARTRSRILAELGLSDGPGFALVTLHRAENTDDPARLREILDFLAEISRNTKLVFPVHPRTRLAAERANLSLDFMMTVPPLGYLDVHRLLQDAIAIYTDSGGLQKEAYFHRVPCVTLREETEWVETVAAGWNRLWRGPDYSPRHEISDFGDGHAGRKIVDELARSA